MPEATKVPPKEYLERFVEYNPWSGVLSWKARPVDSFVDEAHCRSFNTRHAGKPITAKGSQSQGYLVVRINSTLWLQHRVIWMLMTDNQPPKLIDHIDGDGSNNRWENLRDGTHINSKNMSMRSNNISGYGGVYWNSRQNKWGISIKANGKQRHFGFFDDPVEANVVARKAYKRFGYSDRHGVNCETHQPAGA